MNPPEQPPSGESPLQGQQDPMLAFFRSILEEEAYSRVYNLYVMAKGGDKRKSSLLQALYQYLQRLMASGYIRRKIREEELVALLQKLSSTGREGSIKIIRK